MFGTVPTQYPNLPIVFSSTGVILNLNNIVYIASFYFYMMLSLSAAVHQNGQ